MSFEVERFDIELTSYDEVADKLVFKASIPDQFEGTVYEIGLFSLQSDLMTDDDRQVVSEFTQASETWSDGTWSTSNTRLGEDSLRLSPATSSTEYADLETSLDLSSFSPSDSMIIAFEPSSNVDTVDVILMTDSSNYFTATISAPSAEYQVENISKSSFTATGTPDWSNIAVVRVSATATGGGAATVDFDGISFIDQDFANPDFVLVAREVITPFSKVSGAVNEIEFRLTVTV